MSSIPSYLEAADSHTMLNGGTGQESILSAAGDIVTKFIPTAIAAGVNEIYNIVPTVGNYFGGTFEQSDLRTRLVELDNDLANYYDDHKLGVDTAGFVLGSLIPGTTGVKVLNAGQTMLRTAIGSGKFGANMGTALGVLAPAREIHLANAISAIRSGDSIFKLTEANTLKALGAGLWQNTLEAAAFETVVAATMSKSPILDELSTSDLFWNGVKGAALGGAIGGIFSGVGAGWKIASAGRAVSKELEPWSITTAPAANMSASDKILFKANQLDSIAPLPEEGSELFARASTLEKKTREKLMLEIREEFGNLTGGDQALAESLFASFKNSNLEQRVSALLDSQVVGRVNKVTAIESELRNLQKKFSKAELVDPTPEELAILNNNKVSYVKLWGENAGEVVGERPTVLSLMDTASAGEVPVLTKTGVKIGNKNFTHSNNPHRAFNILGADHYTVESRYIWAEKLPKWMPDADDIVIHETDIPLLEKAIRDGVQQIKIIPENGLIADAISVSGDSLIEITKKVKVDIATRLAAAKTAAQSEATKIDKLKNYFGINFNVVDDMAGGYNGWFMRKPTTTVDAFGNTMNIKADAIALERQFLSKNSLSRIAQTLKHEEGHQIFQSLLEARGATIKNLSTVYPQLVGELEKLSAQARPHLWKKGLNDAKLIEYRQKTHELFADAFAWLAKHPDQIQKYPEFNNFAGHLVRPIPREILDAVSTRAGVITQEEIAKIVNVEARALSGEIIDDGANLFARDFHRKQYFDFMRKAGTRESEMVSDPLTMPSYAKVISRKSVETGVDGNQLEGMAIIAQKAKLYDESSRRVATEILGEELPVIPDKVLITGNAGPGFASFASGGMGTIQQVFEYVGQRVKNLRTKAVTAMHDSFAGTLNKLANDLDSSIEWSVLNEKLRSLPQRYTLNADGSKLVYKFRSAADDVDNLLKEEAELVSKNIPAEIPLNSQTVRELVKSHIDRTATYTNAKSSIRANEGLKNKIDPDTFYPIPRSPKDTPFFAFVVDDSATATGHSSMIYASSADQLETIKNKILADPVARSKNLRVLTKAESEAYFKAHGTYEFERTIGENYINTELQRIGVSAALYAPRTDPTVIVKDFLEWHTSRSNNMIREAVAHQYSRQFDALRAQAESSLQAATSKLGYVSPLSYAENAVNNPASNLIKMALDVQKMDEYPFWAPMNKMLDTQVSKYWNKVTELFSNATSQEHLDAVNQALSKTGYHGPLVDEALYKALNSTQPRGVLSQFIGRANALVATFALRLDPLNALNNVVGSHVLLGSEAQSIISAIKKGNAEAAGELAKLANVIVPGTDSQILSPTKLIANSISRYHNNPELRKFYTDHGFISSISNQYDQVLDDVARSIGGDLDIGKAFTRMKEWANKGEQLTGNKVAEEFNRFVAADVMKQITDIAVKHNIIDDKTALVYINTFVNRTQGNYIASQRPLLFQGPVGQAIGLFQTYQFNLIQQLLRHVGEGQGKSVATMLGLQASIYGMNGLPAFNAINTHIIGNASGNVEHKDIIQATYSGAGKVAGDWLVYGGLSNAFGLFDPDLKMNMYSRGDVNPRNLTIVPTDPAKVPIVQAATRLYGQLSEGFSKIGQGAPVWETFLRGLEQNGISRPLAGMAQILEGATVGGGTVTSMNQKGNLLMAHDLMNLASLTRVLGGKPLDEALINDQNFRINAYRAHENDKRAVLGEAIKLNIIGGKELSPEQLEEFQRYYVKTGGKQENFAKFLAAQYKNTTVSQANQLRDQLSSPFSTHLQTIMGGYKLEDLVNQE